jgi:hypothetical protein
MPGLAIIVAAQKDFFLKNLVFFTKRISHKLKSKFCLVQFVYSYMIYL